LNERNAAHYLARLETFRPDFIVGYVSTVHSLALEVLAQGSQGRICPKAVLVSSETLFDWVRADIENAFRCPVFNGYGLGEMTAFISECNCGSLHISPEYGVVEIVAHEYGDEIVSTGLFNYGMPLLRYRTGDLVEAADDRPCPCGRELPTVRAISGRIADCIVTPEGVTVGPAALSLAFQSVPHLKGVQLYQPSRGELRVYIAVADGFDAKGKQILLSELRRRLGSAMVISLTRVDHVSQTAGGKQALILRNAP
jgi:phenylacetate-CoA ligase